MPDRENVIYDIERCICHVPDACRDCSHYGHGEVIGCMEELLTDALELLKDQEDLGAELGNAIELIHKKNERIEKLLKEQDNEKKRIMKVIWDTLHEGLSIDTVADQDWVYERIRHRIEDT